MIEVVAFIGGAVVMILEIVGSRVVAPYLGTSTLVWTSLIGVILASLSVGYWLGGKMADKNASLKKLSLILALGGIFTGAISYFRTFLNLFHATAEELPLAAIAVAILLFAPATIALGMISPYVVRLKLKNVETSGQTVGRLYALSTLGSIVGTFLGGFILISVLGTGKILLLLAVVLLSLAGLVFFRQKLLLTGFILLCSLGSAAGIINAPPEHFKEKRSLVADVDTTYQRIWIYDNINPGNGRTVRFLTSAEFVWQSALDLEKPNELVFEYLKMFDLAFHFKPEITSALLIGGGIYSYPQHFLNRSPQSTIDVVEIDEKLLTLAREYFDYQDNPRLSIIHEDGRYFLNNNNKIYDVIFLDAFSSYLSTPFQLTTKEFLTHVSRSLDANGVVIANIATITQDDNMPLIHAMVKTYQEVFPHVLVFRVDPNESLVHEKNSIVVGFKSTTPPQLTSNDPIIQKYLSWQWDEKKVSKKIPALTDELAPVEKYVAQMIFNIRNGEVPRPADASIGL